MSVKSGLRPIRLALWALVALALIGLAWVQVISPRLQALSDGGMANLGRGDYRLVTGDGQPFTQDSLKGQPTAVFFGFTHCPDVCPTTLGDISGWQEDLARAGKTLRVFLVTVDPERDSPEVMRDYVSWVPGVQGVSGSPEEIAKALKAFRVYARKAALEGGDYTMDHSAMVLLFDRDGRYSGLIGYQEDADRVRASLERLVAG
ncbi:MAG: SCO family protein [Paracoccus sp. (in: a-proteobacteria)]|uniref:SCO family protein n=1 Tax=Paracoccus sp. TaxID=267 RepID=UPI0039E56A21